MAKSAKGSTLRTTIPKIVVSFEDSIISQSLEDDRRLKNNDTRHETTSETGPVKDTFVRFKNFVQNKSALKFAFILVYNLYLGYAIYFHCDRSRSKCDQSDDCWGWCDGLGFIIIVTCLVYVGVAYFVIKRHICHFVPAKLKNLFKQNLKCVQKLIEKHLYIRIGLYLFALSIILGFFVWDTWTDQRRMVSVGGLAAIVIFGAVFSKYPRRINWRQVVWGVSLQLILGLLILRWQLGKSILVRTL